MRLRSRQVGGDPGAGARTSGMAAAAGTVPARMSNTKRFPGVWWMSAGKRKECRMRGHTMIDMHATTPAPTAAAIWTAPTARRGSNGARGYC